MIRKFFDIQREKNRMVRVIDDLRSLGSKLEQEPGYTDDDFLGDGKEVITRFSARYSFVSGYDDGREPIPDGMAFIVNQVCFAFERSWSRPEAHTFIARIHSCSRSRDFNDRRISLSIDAVGLGGDTILRVCRKWDRLANDDKKPFV